MIKSSQQIYLASKSPRRRKLLKQTGIKFRSFSVDVDEEFIDGEHPAQSVKRIALHKANEASLKLKNGILITADTTVVLNKKTIGKPVDEKDAFRILSRLSGKTHTVYTGFVIRNLSKRKQVVDYEKTKVTFRKISPAEIREYIRTGSPMDKAGAYGIQDDFGAVFVEKIDGCYYNVVGLPLTKLYKSLLEIL